MSPTIEYDKKNIPDINFIETKINGKFFNKMFNELYQTKLYNLLKLSSIEFNFFYKI